MTSVGRKPEIGVSGSSSQEAVDLVRRLLGERLPRRGEFEPIRPKPEYFLNCGVKYHWAPHFTRVPVIALNEARTWQALVPSLVIDQAVVIWSGALHDTQRLGVIDDPDHGERAAQWVKAKLDGKLNLDQLYKVMRICRFHSVNGVNQDLGPEAAVVREADRLDRQRLDDFNPGRLKLPFSEPFIAIARDLIDLTDRSYSSVDEAFDRVLDAGVALGIIRS